VSYKSPEKERKNVSMAKGFEKLWMEILFCHM
jgi:hypothetical protein